MKSIFIAVILIVAAFGLIGGIGYALYCKAFIIAIGIIALSYIAYPKAKEMFNNLFKDNNDENNIEQTTTI